MHQEEGYQHHWTVQLELFSVGRGRRAGLIKIHWDDRILNNGVQVVKLSDQKPRYHNCHNNHKPRGSQRGLTLSKLWSWLVEHSILRGKWRVCYSTSMTTEKGKSGKTGGYEWLLYRKWFLVQFPELSQFQIRDPLTKGIASLWGRTLKHGSKDTL